MEAKLTEDKAAVPIPDDLQEQYKTCVICGCSACVNVRELIERASKAEQENADLRKKVAALDWQEITPENLPKVGNAVWSPTQNQYIPHDDMLLRCALYEVVEATANIECYRKLRCTHFRPINAPRLTKGGQA